MPHHPRPQTNLTEAFERTVDALAEGDTEYALIGGFAVAHHGLPRPTRDVDILLKTPRVALPRLLERFADRGFDFELRKVLTEFRDDHLSEIRYRGVRVDLLEAVLPVFSRAVETAVIVEMAERSVRIVRPEDLVVLKLIAGRDDDRRDVRGILAAQAGALDVERVRRALDQSCGAETVAVFERILADSRQ